MKDILAQRGKRLLWLSITLLLACIALIVLSGRQLVQRFAYIEHQQALDQAAQIERALQADLNQLRISTRDYAEWDDAQDYVRSHDAAFERANFQYDTLVGMQVDAVWIVADDGRELFSAQIDPAQNNVVQPASATVLNALRPYVGKTEQVNALPAYRRLLLIDGRLLAFAAVEITRSDRSQATGVTLIFARFLDADEMQRVRDTSQHNVQLTLLSNPALATDSPELYQWATHAPSDTDLRVAALDNEQMSVAVLLRNIAGRAVAVLALVEPREITSFGRRSTWTLLGALIGILVLAGGLIGALVTSLHNKMRSHQRIQQRYINIINGLDELVLLIDRQSLAIKQANPALLRRVGCSYEQLLTMPLAKVFRNLRVTANMDDPSPGNLQECQLQTIGGELVDVEITLSRLADQNDELLCLFGRDVSSRKQAELAAVEHRRKLSYLANQDALTGLPNRLYLQSRLPRLLQRLSEAEGLLAVYYVDMDQFKNINDSRGHPFGDALLKIFSRRLRAAVGSHDVVVRMGGDEFVVVASLLPNVAAVEAIAARLVVAAKAPVVVEGVTLNVSASIGVATYPQDALDADTLLKHADIALYQAKEAGRDTYRLFHPDMNVELGEQVAMEQALRHALDTDQLYVEFQPLVHLSNGKLASMEALLRWRHPELGLIPPSRFVPVAEKGGLVLALGESVLRKVMAQLRQWQDEGIQLCPIAVNVSPLQLQNGDLPNVMNALLLEFGVDAKWLTFEITESAVLRHSQETVVMLETLRMLGSKVAINDFGTGFSNLSYLKMLPIDTLKIDKGFVTDMLTDSSDAAIVGGVLDMARNLRLHTVAEGIETEAQMLKLRELGCTYGQGFYFSRSQSVENCRELLKGTRDVKQFTDSLLQVAVEEQSEVA
ncbi:MAG: EAL domain-containing protein [Steroidobacteraceae bacterium]